MTTTLRIALADDESTARRRMNRLLGAIPGVDVVGCHEDAQGVLDQLQDEAIDVLVLDVQMPGLSGLEAHALMGADAPYVIFATAHPQHAIEAFELGAVDYVLKPIEASRLGKAVERARSHVQRGAVPAHVADPYDRVPVVTREGIVLLDPPAISHAVFDGTLVTVHTTAGQTHLTDATLADLHGRLPEGSFDRVHRRVLLNMHEVSVLRPTPSGGFVAVTRSGAEVPVSRQSARRMRKALGLSKG
ncbi:MAG: LytR/AlgR family response regulator transcription factor [Nannocystaceae bacterium]|nr:LytTR family DNA-binding domain-containing protein [bacterium]